MAEGQFLVLSAAGAKPSGHAFWGHKRATTAINLSVRQLKKKLRGGGEKDQNVLSVAFGVFLALNNIPVRNIVYMNREKPSDRLDGHDGPPCGC